MNSLRTLGGLLLALASLPALALTADEQQRLQHLQSRWAEINYQLPKDNREPAFAALAREAGEAVSSAPRTPELLIWQGIILSTWAGAKGGLGALDLVKQARSSLQDALRLDPKALDGSAYTSLGTLYYQVPGWPIGFGDDAQAETLLKQALALNPDGIDPNYFYGDFLQRQKRYAEARTVLEKALRAPERPGRALADEGRREEVRRLLETVKEKLE